MHALYETLMLFSAPKIRVPDRHADYKARSKERIAYMDHLTHTYYLYHFMRKEKEHPTV